MRLVFCHRKRGGTELGIIYGSIALLALLAARFLPVLEIAPSCTFKLLTGFPCPACGSTRSLAHLANAEFTAAFAMNPLTGAVFSVAVFSLLYSFPAFFFRFPKITVYLREPEKGTLRAAAAMMVLLNWLYLIFFL